VNPLFGFHGEAKPSDLKVPRMLVHDLGFYRGHGLPKAVNKVGPSIAAINALEESEIVYLSAHGSLYHRC
jgi:hypothetical protein